MFNKESQILMERGGGGVANCVMRGCRALRARGHMPDGPEKVGVPQEGIFSVFKTFFKYSGTNCGTFLTDYCHKHGICNEHAIQALMLSVRKLIHKKLFKIIRIYNFN